LTKKLHSEENGIFLEGDCDTYSEDKGEKIQGNKTLGKEESELQQSPIHQKDKKKKQEPNWLAEMYTACIWTHSSPPLTFLNS
jgi:hypothetical protein